MRIFGLNRSSYIRVLGLLLILAAAQVACSAAGDQSPDGESPGVTTLPDSDGTPAEEIEAAGPSIDVPIERVIPDGGAEATAVSPGEAEESASAETPTPATYDATQFMYDFSEGDFAQAAAARGRILDEHDTRFVAVFIELIRAWQIGLVRNFPLEHIVISLEMLTGQTFGQDWASWVEWYGQTDLEPPPGFTSWKGSVLSIIDPGFGEFLQDDRPSNIRSEEIQWGGVLVDGIPALDNPAMLSVAEAEYLNPEDVVFGLAINDDARAYPLRIIDWHEMANDVIGGVPVSLAYCTLCGAAVAYDGRIGGETYTFGSSGFLFRSNKLMYDRQTRTLWNQLTGEPVLGDLVGQDVTLSLLPVVLTTWEEWRDRHPDTLVLDIETGFRRNYEPGAAYGNYFASAFTMFPVAQRSSLLDTKDQVFAMRLDGIPKAYPLEHLATEEVVNDTLGETNLVLVAQRGEFEVDGVNQYVGRVTYTAGGEVRAYDRGERTFAPGDEVDVVIDDSGGRWQVTDDALLGPDGETAPRLPGHLAYWFGWFAFFPQTAVYGQ